MKLNFLQKFTNQDLKTKAIDDPLIKLIGHFGKWQKLIFFTIFLVKFSSGWVQLMILFLTPKFTFWCIQFDSNAMKVGQNMTCYTDCLKYGYDTSPFENTIISEWDLVCDRLWLASFTQTVLQFGILIGSSLFGFLADRYGRRYTFLSSVVLLIVFGLIIPYAPNYYIFTTARFFVGVATAGTMVISFVIFMETIGSKYREILGCLYHIPFIIGQLTLPLFAYYLRTWNMYTLALGVPPILYLGYFLVIKESPRWLLSVGKVEGAVKLVTEAAKMNNLPTNNIREVITKFSNEIRSNKAEQPKLNYIDLFKTRTLRHRTLCSCVIWFVSGLSFFGVNQYISQTSPNPFASVAAAGAIQIPANLFTMWLIRKLGRKSSVITFFTLTALCVIVLGFISNIFWLTLTVGTLAVSCSAIVCTSIYIYSSELFPTVVRNMGLGISSTAMRFGSMLAPFVSNLSMQAFWLPPLIFAVTPLVAALLCLFLPETNGRKLPDSIDDIKVSE